MNKAPIYLISAIAAYVGQAVLFLIAGLIVVDIVIHLCCGQEPQLAEAPGIVIAIKIAVDIANAFVAVFGGWWLRQLAKRLLDKRKNATQPSAGAAGTPTAQS